MNAIPHAPILIDFTTGITGLIALILPIVFSSSAKDTEETVAPLAKASIESKWVLEDYPKPVVLFEDGLRYPYSRTTADCDSFLKFVCGGEMVKYDDASQS